MGLIMHKGIAYGGGGSSVTEGYYKVADGKFYEHFDGTTYSDEITGEDGILYLDLSTNNMYRWSTGASLFVLVGKSTLASLNDTNISSPTDGEILSYDGTNSKWENKSLNIPTVNDGVLTIQKDGADIETFSANSASNKMANITVAPDIATAKNDLTVIAEKTDTTPYIYRPSVANGDRVSEDIVGASVGWNQLEYNGNFASTSGWSRNGNTTTFSVANNEATIVATNSNHGIFNSVQITSGHKYLLSLYIKSTQGTRVGIDITSLGDISAKSSYFHYVRRYNASSTTSAHTTLYTQGGTENTINVKDVCLFDLTLMFGSVIADYVYSLGSDAAYSFLARNGFITNSYYPYNAGELLSVEVEGKKYVGKNLLDPLANESGRVKVQNGITFVVNDDGSITCNGTATAQARFYFKSDLVFPFDVIYSCENGDTNKALCYAGGQNISGTPKTFTAGTSLATNFVYVANGKTVTNYTVKPMIRRADVTDATYEPYRLTTYTFPSQTLRGLFTLANGELKASGDVYGDDGVVTRKYGIVDLGSLTWEYKSSSTRFVVQTSLGIAYPSSTSDLAKMICAKYRNAAWADLSDNTIDKIITTRSDGISIRDLSAGTDPTVFKNSLNGVYLVYELAAHTTEQAEPLVMPQICDKNGTEEFITDGIVPVGHESTYYNYPDYMEEGEYKDFRDRVDYAPEKAKWKNVGSFVTNDTVEINGWYNEIMLVGISYQMQSVQFECEVTYLFESLGKYSLNLHDVSGYATNISPSCKVSLSPNVNELWVYVR